MSIRWYLTDEAVKELVVFNGELWFLNRYFVGAANNLGVKKIEVKVDHPLVPALMQFGDDVMKLDQASQAVSFKGVVRRMKLLQGEYRHDVSTGSSVFALPDGDYRIEIASSTLEGIQLAYRALLIGFIRPKTLWRGIDASKVS